MVMSGERTQIHVRQRVSVDDEERFGRQEPQGFARSARGTKNG
jgi:hypothetical protein